MPGIFKEKCAKCDEVAGDAGLACIASAVESEPLFSIGGFPDCGIALRRDDGTFEYLPHPCEFSALERQGITREEIVAAGRVYEWTMVICQHCGEQNTSFTPVYERPIDRWVPPAALIFGALWLFDIELIYCVLAAGAWVAGCIGLSQILVRQRRKALAFPQAPCHVCGHANLLPICTQRQEICPLCHERTLTYNIIAIS